MATDAASLDSAPHAVISAGVSSRVVRCRLPPLLSPLLLSPARLWLPPLLLFSALLPPEPSSRSRLRVNRCREAPSAACFSSS